MASPLALSPFATLHKTLVAQGFTPGRPCGQAFNLASLALCLDRLSRLRDCANVAQGAGDLSQASLRTKLWLGPDAALLRTRPKETTIPGALDKRTKFSDPRLLAEHMTRR